MKEKTLSISRYEKSDGKVMLCLKIASLRTQVFKAYVEKQMRKELIWSEIKVESEDDFAEKVAAIAASTKTNFNDIEIVNDQLIDTHK